MVPLGDLAARDRVSEAARTAARGQGWNTGGNRNVVPKTFHRFVSLSPGPIWDDIWRGGAEVSTFFFGKIRPVRVSRQRPFDLVTTSGASKRIIARQRAPCLQVGTATDARCSHLVLG